MAVTIRNLIAPARQPRSFGTLARRARASRRMGREAVVWADLISTAGRKKSLGGPRPFRTRALKTDPLSKG